MKVRPVGAELFYADGRTDGRIWRSQYSLFAILRTHLKDTNSAQDSASQAHPWLFLHSDIHTTLPKKSFSCPSQDGV